MESSLSKIHSTKYKLILAAVCLVLSAFSLVFSLTIMGVNIVEIFGFSFDLFELISCVLSFIVNVLILNILFYMMHSISAKLKNTLWFIGLLICGLLAEFVLFILFKGLFSRVLGSHASILISLFFTTLFVDSYIILVLYLCFAGGLESESRFWEVFRFAIVGAIAALFDFTVCYSIRYLLLLTSLNQSFISAISVFCGFVVGVIINYLCSVSIVFKTGDNKFSKTKRGIILFVALSAVGLGIGIGLEILFVDVLGLMKIISFLIRTIVVLIWNYVSRKVFIFKNESN